VFIRASLKAGVVETPSNKEDTGWIFPLSRGDDRQRPCLPVAAHAVACRALRVRHIRTPRRPRTNGKAERFIGTIWVAEPTERSTVTRSADRGRLVAERSGGGERLTVPDLHLVVDCLRPDPGGDPLRSWPQCEEP
jgi:hypothetical protein